MRLRPSTIDIFLSANPARREEFIGWAQDIGLTVEDVLAKMTEAGVDTSKSAVGRWRLRFQRRLAGHASQLRVAVFDALAVADDETLQAVADLLKIS